MSKPSATSFPLLPLVTSALPSAGSTSRSSSLPRSRADGDRSRAALSGAPQVPDTWSGPPTQSFLLLAPDATPCRLGCDRCLAQRDAFRWVAATGNAAVPRGTFSCWAAQTRQTAEGLEALTSLGEGIVRTPAILSALRILPAKRQWARVLGAAVCTPQILRKRGCGANSAQDRDRPSHGCGRPDPLEHAPARDRVANLRLELVHGTPPLAKAPQASAVAFARSLTHRTYVFYRTPLRLAVAPAFLRRFAVATRTRGAVAIERGLPEDVYKRCSLPPLVEPDPLGSRPGFPIAIDWGDQILRPAVDGPGV